MSGNVDSVKKKIQIHLYCLHCKKTDEKENYYEIFDEVGVQLKLDELLLKYFKLNIVKSNSTEDQLICEPCLDKLTNALDEDEYNKEKKRDADAKKRSATKRNPNNTSKSPKNQSNDEDHKSEKKITKTPKKATPPKKDKEDVIDEIIQQDLVKNSTETQIVQQTDSIIIIKDEENVGNIADNVVDDDKVIVEGTEILFDDIEKYNIEDQATSSKIQNCIEYVISGGGGGGGEGEYSGLNNADDTYDDDFEHIEDCPNEEGCQDGIELFTVIPFTKEDDDKIVDITSYLDEAIKSNLTSFKFSWITECDICSWRCQTFESLVAHVYAKHNVTNNLYACPAKGCDQQLEGKKLLTRHLILQHGPINKLLIYGSCPDCGLTFSNFMVFNRHSCARMIKRRRGMRLHCKLCEIDFSSMKRYVFHMQFHLEKHRPKVCLICNYKSNDIEELFEHINYDHELQDVYPCRICDRSFKEKQSLLDHKHTDNDPFICKECNRSYHFKASLMAHIKKAHGPVLHCYSCNKKFSSEANYRYHQKSHTNKSTALHACSNCGLISAYRSRILDHINENGSDCFGVEVEDEVVSVAYTCEFCLHDFKSKCDLKLHRSTGVHADGLYFCVPCNKTIPTWKLFRSHRRHITAQWKRENICYLYMCNVGECEESYTRWNSLYSHKRRHHNGTKSDDADFEEEPEEKTDKKAKLFVCQFCDKSCPSKMSLSVHIARRHNNKNVECSVCNAGFKNEQALKKHFDYLHVEIECSMCLKVIKNRRNYDVHERVVHMAEKRYFCNICSKGFYHKADKEAHVKVHEETYSCERCDFTTNYAKSLEIHTSSFHRRVFNYKCEECKKYFARKSALATHTAKYCKVKRFVCKKPKDISCRKAFRTLALLKRHLKCIHDGEDDYQYMPSDHEEGPPPVKRSKRLQLKDNKRYAISDNTNNDDGDVGQVTSIDENEIQDDANSIQYELVDDEIEHIVDELIDNDDDMEKVVKDKRRQHFKYEVV